MNIFRTIILTSFTVLLFTIGGYSQGSTASKVGVINTNSFGDAKGGITKYIAALNALNKEFAPAQTELESLVKRLNDISKEIETLRNQAASGTVPVNQKAGQAKVDEAEKLQRDLSFKQEDAKARFEKRQRVVLAPVMEEIANALEDYAKQNGYAIIFDVAKDQAGLLIMIGDDKVEITKAFISYYNARSGAVPAK